MGHQRMWNCTKSLCVLHVYHDKEKKKRSWLASTCRFPWPLLPNFPCFKYFTSFIPFQIISETQNKFCYMLSILAIDKNMFFVLLIWNCLKAEIHRCHLLWFHIKRHLFITASLRYDSVTFLTRCLTSFDFLLAI